MERPPPMPTADRAEVRWNAAYGNELCRRAIERLFAGAGARAAHDTNPLQRFSRDLNTATHQLMHSDGFSTVTPVLDNVAGLDFEYYGDPSPPIFARPDRDRTVTYGPSPPALGVTQAPFAAGENCTWQTSGGSIR